MKVRILTETDCRAVLGMEEAIDLQATAFQLLYEGASVEGLRSYAKSENPPGLAIFNPCFLRGGRGYGIKVVSDFYENDEERIPRMSASMTLMNGETGAPHTFMEAGYLTDLRTGAGTGLAAKYLARQDSRKLAVIGAGRVAMYQIHAITSALGIERVEVSTRTRSRGERLVDALRDELETEIVLVDSPSQALAGADVVVAATTANSPVVPGELVEPGTFVVSAGAALPTSRELDTETVRKAEGWYIDSRADCLDDAGDYLMPADEGVLDLEDVLDLGAVVAGASPARESESAILTYKSIGVPIQDLITGQEIAARARSEGIGVEMEMNP